MQNLKIGMDEDAMGSVAIIQFDALCIRKEFFAFGVGNIATDNLDLTFH